MSLLRIINANKRCAAVLAISFLCIIFFAACADDAGSAEIPNTTPTSDISTDPTTAPAQEPAVSTAPAASAEPTAEPTSEPTPAPTPEPTPAPTPEPTVEPAPDSTPAPTPVPTAEPTPEPTSEPTPEPTPEPTSEPTPEPTVEPTSEPTPEPSSAPQTGEDYLGKFIFLGDSTTYGLGYYGIVDKSQIWTPTSGTLTLDLWNYSAIYYPRTGQELLLTQILEIEKPEYLCITLGVNGVSFMGEDYFKQVYTSLVQTVQQLSPGTTIILNSIYPVTDSYEAKGNGINNTKIAAANTWVQSVAQTCGVYYLNSAQYITDANGDLPEEYCNGDGLHLNPTSFSIVINCLLSQGY